MGTEKTEPQDRTAPLWRLIRNVTVRDLQERLFAKYSATLAKMNWEKVERKDLDRRADELFTYLNRLHDRNLKEYMDIYSALSIISIGGESKAMQRASQKIIDTKPAIDYLNVDLYNVARGGDENLTTATNRVAWLCVRPELDAEWKEMVSLAMFEQARSIPWKYFDTTPPGNRTPDEIKEGIAAFEAQFRKDMEAKKRYGFPVSVQPYPPSGRFVRYVISTPQDPQHKLLVDKNAITIGLDPTANNFLVDHYFATDTIRVSYPVVIDEELVAKLFAELVLKANITEEKKLSFEEPLTKYTSSRSSASKMELTKAEKEDISYIRIASISFTYAETAEEANLRKQKGRKNRKRKHATATNDLLVLEPRPAFKCYSYSGHDIYRYLDEHFSPDRYPAKWRTILSITFAVALYKHEYAEGKLLKSTDTKEYKIIVKPTNIDYSPKWHEIDDPRHRDLLNHVKTKLGLVGKTLEEIAQEARERARQGREEGVVPDESEILQMR